GGGGGLGGELPPEGGDGGRAIGNPPALRRGCERSAPRAPAGGLRRQRPRAGSAGLPERRASGGRRIARAGRLETSGSVWRRPRRGFRRGRVDGGVSPGLELPLGAGPRAFPAGRWVREGL